MNPEILLSEAKEMQLLLTKHRRYLHTHPELGFDLRQTKEYVKKELISIGYEPVECGKCGLVVLAGSKNSDKTFLIRADMDALPILEQADVKFKSENSGKMHACGHDMHTAMLLGAARLLKRHENELKGTIKLMFQPAEETLDGCKDMVGADVLNNPTVDAALMLHVTLGMPLQTGSAIICDGGISAPAADYFEIKIQGKGCHGAMPELGVDPITIASHIVIALQELHARELAMADDAVLTIGTMQAGDANNIIPDTAVLRGIELGVAEWVNQFINLYTFILEKYNFQVAEEINIKNIFKIKVRDQSNPEFKNIPLKNYFEKKSSGDYTRSSIHGVKGETYDAVLIYIKSKTGKTLTPKFLMEGELEDELMRIAYVAMTRPRRLLMIAMPENKKLKEYKRFPTDKWDYEYI